VLTIASYKFLKPFMPHKGHSRPMQPVLPAGSRPLRSETDRNAAVPRIDALGTDEVHRSK
jgi:hypothetical protein